MPKAKFDEIYKDLRQKIEEGTYEFQEMLPSENKLITVYDCSRNTVRRAIAMLVAQGYAQSMHGKGVRIIYQPLPQNEFEIGGVESFKESAIRNNKKAGTKVIQFATVTVDKRIASRTGFPEGTEVYYIQRIRYIDDEPLILDINMFRKDVVPGLTLEIAKESIYDYIENTLGMRIITSKRSLTVEHMTQVDENNLKMGDYNCVAVITGHTYNADGVMFEYTQSRHQPANFCFQTTAPRRKPAPTP